MDQMDARYIQFRAVDSMYAFYFATAENSGTVADSGPWSWKSSAERMLRRWDMDASHWRISQVNVGCKLAETLPEHLIVPAAIDDRMLINAAQFRALQRLPHVVYCHSRTGAVLARSGQPLVGAKQKRNLDDEQYVQHLLKCNSPTDSTATTAAAAIPCVIDTRSKSNVQQHRLKGGGTEADGGYANLRPFFVGLDEPSAIRSAYYRLLEGQHCCFYNKHLTLVLLVMRSADASVSNFLSDITPWMKLVQAALRPAIFIAGSIVNDGVSCLVHCDEGLDTTALIVSLAKVIADPFYRRFQGLFHLMEEDWIHAGHRFTERSAKQNTSTHSLPATGSTTDTSAAGGVPEKEPVMSTSSTVSPVFVLFLECMHQVMSQFPLEFEYNVEALVFIFQHTLNCQYGQFLFNTPRERAQERVCDRTKSLWDTMERLGVIFTNPAYRHDISAAPLASESQPLPVSVNSKRLALSRGFYDPWNSCTPLSEFQRYKYGLTDSSMTTEELFIRLQVPSLSLNDQQVWGASLQQAAVRAMKLEVRSLLNELIERPLPKTVALPGPPVERFAVEVSKQDGACVKCGPLCMCSLNTSLN